MLNPPPVQTAVDQDATRHSKMMLSSVWMQWFNAVYTFLTQSVLTALNLTTSSTANPGYTRFANGFTIQTGSVALTGTTPVVVNFAKTFTVGPTGFGASIQSQQETLIVTASTTQLTLTGAAAGTPTANWWAFGTT